MSKTPGDLVNFAQGQVVHLKEVSHRDGLPEVVYRDQLPQVVYHWTFTGIVNTVRLLRSFNDQMAEVVY